MSCKRTSVPEFSGGNDFWNMAIRGASLLLCVLLLSSCGPVSSIFDRDRPTAAGAQSPAPGEESAAIAPLTGATGPPGAGERPPLPGETGTEYGSDGLPVLQPRGVNLEKLFAERIRDADDRFERVENAVLELRRDFDAVLPAIVRLAAVEEDMQDLIQQLDQLLRTEPPPAAPPAPAEAAPMPLLPEPSPPAPAAVAQPPPAPPAVQPAPAARAPPPAPAVTARPAPTPPPVAGGPVRVLNARTGEHKDKTRLVLDVSGPATYRYDLDNAEKLLVIEIPEAGWAGAAQETLKKAPLIASWTVLPLDNGQGSRMIVQLRHEAQVVYETTLAASRGAPHRLVLDLRSAAVHR